MVGTVEGSVVMVTMAVFEPVEVTEMVVTGGVFFTSSLTAETVSLDA